MRWTIEQCVRDWDGGAHGDGPALPARRAGEDGAEALWRTYFEHSSIRRAQGEGHAEGNADKYWPAPSRGLTHSQI